MSALESSFQIYSFWKLSIKVLEGSKNPPLRENWDKKSSKEPQIGNFFSSIEVFPHKIG